MRDEEFCPICLTEAQRKVIAEILPTLAPRLLLDMAGPRTVRLTVSELNWLAHACSTAASKSSSGMKRNSLRHAAAAANKGKQSLRGIARIPASERLYQFKITLKNVAPPIWRRIQTRDCTLDRLHVHIQTAMGWTNSHLHLFTIGDVYYGDPDLLSEDCMDEDPPEDSLSTKICKIVPADGKRFRFDYEYDFGDRWKHEILFEGCLRTAKGTRTPLCVEGERACPPEDVGGTRGYQNYLTAIADPGHPEHESTLVWNGPFDPEAFDAKAATKRMRRGLPDWRRMM